MMPVTGDSPGPDAATDRFETAASALDQQRRSIPLERMLAVIGSLLLPLGVVLIVLGWYGAARTTREWEQLPYVVSGGLLGLSLVFIGGFTYFASWLTRLVQAAQAQTAEMRDVGAAAVAVLARVEELLGPGALPPATDDAALVATATGSMVHRADCTMVAGKRNLQRIGADGGGLKPCLICNPPVGAANGRPARRQGARA